MFEQVQLLSRSHPPRSFEQEYGFIHFSPVYDWLPVHSKVYFNSYTCLCQNSDILFAIYLYFYLNRSGYVGI